MTLQTFIPATQQTVEDENTPGTEAYFNKEEAKKDFVRLLRRTEIETNSQWNEVLPLIIKNPAFRAVKDPVERKQLFDNYLQTLRTEVEEKEKDRRHRVREGFMQMCRRHPDIKYYTRYKTARPILQDENDFKACKDEEERKELFDEYREEALKAHEKQEHEEREKARIIFREILEQLKLEPYARWRPTKELFERKIQEEARQDDLSNMAEIDYLTVFEDYVKELEKKSIGVRQAEKDAKYRTERKRREVFNALLQELVKEGIIIEGTKWKEIFPLLKDDERFRNMLGQSGSTPLELFWDVVDALDIEFRLKRDYVLDVLEEKRFEVSELTKYDEFKSLMLTDQRTSVIPPELLERIFQNLVNKARRHGSSRESRKKSDAFRSLLRHMPEVRYDSTWDTIRPLVLTKDEFKALESEEERIAVFDKVIRRLKEKREEEKRYREHERGSKREREGSTHRSDRHDSKSRRPYDDEERSRSRPRSTNRDENSKDKDRSYRDRERDYSRRDELEYRDESERDRGSKRRSEEDLRQGDRKVRISSRHMADFQRSRKDGGLDYGEKEDGEVSEEGEIPD